MNTPKKISIYIALLCLSGGSVFAQSSIINTKHNLSAGSSATIHAQTEQQVCVFCHTPHHASTTAQLWNRSQPTTSYTLYTSDYLTSLSPSYPSVTQPGSKSKLCLSCHDGTIALGTLLNVPGPTMGGTVTMANSVTTMPLTSPGLIGSNLANDHPVGMGYDPNSDQELVTRAWPWTSKVQLDPNASTGKVECVTCHNPHNNTYSPFLQMSNANAGLCTFCHTKTNFSTSIHRTSNVAYTPTGGSATTVGEWSCRSCHKSHSAGGSMYILKGSEQLSCYDGSGTGCHGQNAPVARRIETELSKTWNHPTNSTNGLHKDLSGGESATDLGSSNRHAECPDCHNPHQAEPNVAKASRGALRISGTLKGVWGVEPTWPTPLTSMTNNDVTFSTPTTFTRVANPIDEYQVCLKCHSGYVTLPAGKRDIAKEINPNYASFHGIVPGGTTNTYVTTTTTNAPWGANKRVWCSDCHGSESTSSPAGSHGSTLNNSGPGTSNTDKMLVATIQSSAASMTPLCLVCHKSTSYFTNDTGSNFQDHSKNDHHVAEGCFACHMWDHAGTTLNTGGNSEKLYVHGLNKRYYWRESGTALTAGTQQMANRFLSGYVSDVNFTTRRCWTDQTSNVRGCEKHRGGTGRSY
ncbi:MAG: cytochrome c3 family protein [Bacteroidota bacterium]